MIRRWVDVKFFLRGLAAIALIMVAVALWLLIAGAPPAAPQTPAISVPIIAEATAPPAATSETPAAPAAGPTDTSKLPPPPNQDATAAEPAAEPADKRPQIAIIVTELGLNQKNAATATQKLPAPIALAFLPFGDVSAMTATAKTAGHDILLDLPMEPMNYPDDNPGTGALMTNVGDVENQHRLNDMLAKMPNAVGAVLYMGSRFAGAAARLKPVVETLIAHKLLIVDNNANPLSAVPEAARDGKLPFAIADVTIDADPSPAAIDAALAKLESIAQAKGKAVGLAGTYPITLDRLAAWTAGLKAKGIVLVPISAVVTHP